MDFADDVAYSVHDLEDGIVGGLIDLSLLDSPTELAGVWQTVRDWYLPDADDTALADALQRLRGYGTWPGTSYDGSRRGLATLKNLTSDLIGVFCGSVHTATRERFGDAPLVRHCADLVVPDTTVHEIAVLKGLAAHYVMRTDARAGIMGRQRELLAELFEALVVSEGRALDSTYTDDIARAMDDAARTRVVVDQIASLTDASAVTWHLRLTGGVPA
jgi:dGTPase